MAQDERNPLTDALPPDDHGSWLLRTVLLLRASRFINGQPIAPPLPVTAGTGRRRSHLLVCGSGIAMSYGVPFERDALTGHLAAQAASATGDTVTVEALVQPRVGLMHQRLLLGDAPEGRYAGVVWSPTFLDAAASPTPRRLAELDAVVARLRAVSIGWVVVIGIPEIAGTTRLDALSQRQSQRANEVLRLAALRQPGVAFVAPPQLSTIRHDDAFDSDYFRRCAAASLRAASGLAVPA